MAGQKKERKARRPLRRLVLLSGLSENVARETVELVSEWHWDLRASWITPNEWPDDKPVAGALIGEFADDPLARRLLREKCPVVRLGLLPHPDDRLLPAVLPDCAASGRLAAEHFAARGFRTVAFVGFDPEDPEANAHLLYKAFLQRAEALGMICLVKKQHEKDEEKIKDKYKKRIAMLADWLRTLSKPVGVFTYDDVMSTRLFLACTKAGVAVPEEAALLGYGNSVNCELTAVGLSSIDPADDERIRTALQLLHRLMEGAPAPREPILVPPRGIVERRSTDVLAVSDPVIARALRFIWDHFDQNLSIQDIAEAVGIPRRSLERGFRQHLDRSVHAELGRKRVTELRRLLLSTDAPLASLAARAGFFTLANAHKSFRRAYGVPPHKFRAKHRDGVVSL